MNRGGWAVGPRPQRRLPAKLAVGMAMVASILVLAAGALHEVADSEQMAPAARPAASPLAAATNPEPAAVAPRTPPAVGGPLLLVGDSLTVGANEVGLGAALRADGWEPETVAARGVSTRWALAELKYRSSVPATVLVELGTNPWSTVGTFPDDVRNLLDLLEQAGATRIVWVTPVARSTNRYDDKANVLFAAAEADPVLEVADWSRIAKANSQLFVADGLHYTTNGYETLIAFIAGSLRDGVVPPGIIPR